MSAELVLDALEQAIWSRSGIDGVVHHSDRGSQYLSIRYSERLAEAGAEPSVGSVGDSYDGEVSSVHGSAADGGLTQTRKSPENSGRFRPPVGWVRWA